MDNDRNASYTDELREIKEHLAKLTTAIVGDPMRGESGVLQNMRQMMLDAYGEKDDRKRSWKFRIEILEDRTQKWMWMASGGVLVVGFLWEVAKETFFKH